MSDTGWDPLASGTEAEGEIVAAAQKRQIRNILKSYVGMYDPFSELLQNALDAVDRRKDLAEDGYVPRLWIEIDLAENSFTVTDNGIGFREREFRSFLAPNISFKDGGKTRGNKGVGATYIAYGFDNLRFGTKGNGHEFVGEIRNGREWVDDDKGIVTRPVVNPTEEVSKFFNAVDRGSSFKIKFGGSNSRPKDLSWYAAATADQWLYLLLVRTPLGTIRYLGEGEKPATFDLIVQDKAGNMSVASNVDAAYMFPHTKIGASVDLKDVLLFQQKALASGKDAAVLPAKYSKLNGIYEFFSAAQIKSLRNWTSEQTAADILDSYEVEAYGYFAHSTSVWDQLNDVQAKLRRGYRVLKGGLQLANNGMIQGDLIVIPLTSNTGYQNQAHIVVHFRGADPDLGRKGFQPELKNAAELVAVAIVNRHKAWRAKLLKADTGSKPNIDKELALHDWVSQQEAHERANPLVITNQNFFAPTNEISITSLPRSEQDVIVLFNQLIAGGVIRGMRLLATNQATQYDGIFKFCVVEPISNHVFDKDLNPLGVEELHHDKELISAPKILEYKFDLDALMREFENGEKNEKEVHLAVTWELGTKWRERYEALSLLDLDNIHQRDFHGLTHILNSGTTHFYVICLKEMVEYLNDVEGVQPFHKSTYSDFVE